MKDRSSFCTGNHQQCSFPFRPGDAVRVKRGALAGVTGIVQRVTDDKRCLITIDVEARGVSALIAASSLELADSLSY